MRVIQHTMPWGPALLECVGPHTYRLPRPQPRPELDVVWSGGYLLATGDLWSRWPSSLHIPNHWTEKED